MLRMLTSESDGGIARALTPAALRRRTGLVVVSLMFALLVAGVTSGVARPQESIPEASSGAIVATYDGGQVTAVQLQGELRKALEKYGSLPDLDEFKKNLLARMVTNELLIVEARDRGFLDEEGVRDPEIISSKEKVMVNTLRRDVILPGLKVSEDEVKALYERARTLRITRAVMLGNRQEAETVLQELKAGADFAELAAKWSLDVDSAGWKGILGMVEVGHGPSSIEDVVFELGPGEIAGPIETAKGFYVVRVDSIMDMEQRPYEDRREYLMFQVRKRKHTPVIAAFMDSVFQAYDVRYRDDAIAAVVDRFAREGWVSNDKPGRWSRTPEFPPEELQMAMVSYKNGSYTLGDYIEFVREARIYPALYLAGREEVERGLRAFTQARLEIQVAYELGVDKTNSVRGHVRQKAREKGVTDLMVEVAGGEESARATEEDRRAYYEKHINRYTEPGAVVVEMLTISDRDAAEDLHQDVLGGLSFSEAAADYRWILDEAKTAERVQITKDYEDPRVFETARRLQVGEVSQPIPLSEGGYCLLRILERQPGRTLPYEDVQEEVRVDLNLDILKAAATKLEEYGQGLREKYHYQVNEDVLAAVQL